MSWGELSSLVRYDLHEGADAVTVRLAGEVDLSSSARLAELLEATGRNTSRVLLDLSRVSFLDARGLSLLLLGERRLRERGVDLLLRHPHRAVRRLLQLCGPDAARLVEEPAGRLEQTDEVVAICAEALGAAIRISGATMGEAQLADSSGALRLVAAQGLSRTFLDFFEVVDDLESACGAAWASGEAVFVPDVARSPIFLGTPSLDVVRDAGIRSIGSIPLQGARQKPMGMLSVLSVRAGDWTTEQKQQLRALATSTSRLIASRTG